MNQSVIWDRAAGITIESLPEPSATAGQVVLRVDASELCGTDLHIAAGEYPLAKSPVVLGHEYAGTIVEIGTGVHGWWVGDRVVVDPNIPCGGCRFCHDAKPYLCAHPECLGVTIDGGMAQYSVVPVSRIYRVPDELSMAAALTEPLACALQAVDRANLRAGDTAIVLGAGPIGLLCSALLKTAGASQILVSDPQDARRAHIAEFGGDPLTPDQVPAGEADVVLECVGRSETMLAATRGASRGHRHLGWRCAARRNRPRESVRYPPAGDHDSRNVHKPVHDGSLAGDPAIRGYTVGTPHHPPVASGAVPGGVGCACARAQSEGLRGAKRRLLIDA